MSTSISRAKFLKGLAGLAAAGLCGTTLVEILKKSRPGFPCRMLGPSKELGHLLRDPAALAALRNAGNGNSGSIGGNGNNGSIAGNGNVGSSVGSLKRSIGEAGSGEISQE